MTSRLKALNLTIGVKHSYHAHCGPKAQLRNLRHRCHAMLKARDSQSVAACARVTEATKDEPQAEYGRLHLMSAALTASEETGETWITCLHYFLDKFEDQREAFLKEHSEQAS